jgi:hypothetical protein
VAVERAFAQTGIARAGYASSAPMDCAEIRRLSIEHSHPTLDRVPRGAAVAGQMMHDMNAVEFEEGAIRIDAAIIAEGLGIQPARVHHLLRKRRITSLCERGIDEDAGRHRLTFFHRNRRLRFVADAAGSIIERSLTYCDDGEAP